MEEPKTTKIKCSPWYTRLPQAELDILERMSKERFGMKSSYQLLQFVGGIFAAMGREKRDVSDEEREFLKTFLTPFVEIEDAQEFLNGYKKAVGIDAQGTNGHGDIEKAVIIRKGGFIETISRNGKGKPVVSFSRDDAALDVLTAGRPTLRALIESVMKGNKCLSFVENTRLLYNDVLEELVKGNGLVAGLGYASNTYGIVPKRVKNKNLVP